MTSTHIVRNSLNLRTSRSAAVIVMLVGALALSACAADTNAAASAGGTTASATPGNGPDATPGSSAEPTPSTGPDAPATLTGEACLPGNWRVDNEEFKALMAGASGGTVHTMSGSAMVTFREDGSTSTAYDAWKYEVTLDGQTVTLMKNGTDHGTYTVAADGSITWVDTDMSSTTESTVEVDGDQVTMVVEPAPSVFSDAAFTCQGDLLTVTAEGATTTLHRET